MSSIIENHPDWWHPVPGMQTLIIGSFPPHSRQWRYPFYYPNKQNRFWPVLAKIAGVELSGNSVDEMIEERKRILEKLSVGVHNIAKVISRQNGSSLDSDIEILEFQDLLGMIDDNPHIKTLILTGYSSASGAAPAFRSYLEHVGVDTSLLPKKLRAGDYFILNHRGRKIKCVAVNSTSRAAFQVSFEMLERQFGEILSFS